MQQKVIGGNPSSLGQIESGEDGGVVAEDESVAI